MLGSPKMTRTALHKLIDVLPDDKLDETAQLIEAYRQGDMLTIRFLTAPEVEPDPEEIAALDELTEEDLNDTISLEDVKRHFGIT